MQFGNSAHIVKVVKGDTQWWSIIYQWKCISSWHKIWVVDLWYNRGIQKRIFTASFSVTGGFCVWKQEIHGVSPLWNFSHHHQYTNVIVNKLLQEKEQWLTIDCLCYILENEILILLNFILWNIQRALATYNNLIFTSLNMHWLWEQNI